MLEMIMKLNIPLYVMTSMGCIGGLGMLATNLTYRRMIRNTQREKERADIAEKKADEANSRADKAEKENHQFLVTFWCLASSCFSR